MWKAGDLGKLLKEEKLRVSSSVSQVKKDFYSFKHTKKIIFIRRRFEEKV